MEFEVYKKGIDKHLDEDFKQKRKYQQYEREKF